MGPLVTSDHCKKVEGYVEKGVAEGATPLVDGRERQTAKGGFFLGPTIFDHVTPEMTIAREEIFGPVLSVMRVKTLDEAIELVNRSPFGNATAIFTQSGKSAREYSSRCEVGMVGVNVGVAAPMAFFPFAGWKNSFFGDLHAHGKDAVAFLHRAESDYEPVVLVFVPGSGRSRQYELCTNIGYIGYDGFTVLRKFQFEFTFSSSSPVPSHSGTAPL